MKADDQVSAPSPRSSRSKVFRRGPCEAAASAIIAAGVVMLMQPFSITLYGWSFAMTLTGVLAFMIGSKLPE